MQVNFERLIITKDQDIKTVMERLEETKQKNLYVVDENCKLMGSVADGDIRRGILKGISLNEKIELIMNKNPKVLMESQQVSKAKIRNLMIEHRIQTIPIINSESRILDILSWIDLFDNFNEEKKDIKNNKVFIVAGGKGSRLEPFTKILPKPLIPIDDETIIEKIMDNFIAYGFTNFILSLNYKAEIIKLYFSDKDIKQKYSNVEYVEESFSMGTIGSLSLAKDYINDTFFISNCDVIINEDMSRILSFHKESNTVLTIVGCVKNSVIPYGVLKLKNDGLLENIDEKPQYMHIINTGLYIAEPEILNYLNCNEKMDITELIGKLLNDSKRISVFPITDNQWFDIGQWEEYKKTKKFFESL